MTQHVSAAAALRLRRPVDLVRDHYRGEETARGAVSLVIYGDFQCPYCRKLRLVLDELREALGGRLLYVFRHFPNERAHPGATFVSQAAEAAGDRFFDMHDWIYEQDNPVTREELCAYAATLGLDMEKFRRDLCAEETRLRVEEDLAEGRRNGVTGTPTVFIDGVRYDGAWDFYSMLEAVQRPMAVRLGRSARSFANLPASGGIVLLLAAFAALICTNTPLAPYYHQVMDLPFGIGPENRMLSLTLGAWCSEGLLAVFFLLVGLEIRREVLAGDLADPRAAALPVVAAIGGCVVPALIYLAFNRGLSATGWAVPTATDVAFTLGILALFGPRIPASLRLFVAAFAVVDDILSVLTLAVFYARDFTPGWLLAGGGVAVLLATLNRARVYSVWPYVVSAVMLGLFLHNAGVHAALAGVVLAAFLPTRPAPSASPLLAQAATALAALETAESEARLPGHHKRRLEQEPIWEWASRNLFAASDRLMSPSDRAERAVAPWTNYVILPLFAFSATGVTLSLSPSPENQAILTGVIAGLVLGKPVGIILFALAGRLLGWVRLQDDISLRQFLGASCLCGIGDTVALLIADQAFVPGDALNATKIGVLIASLLAALAGAAILATAKQTHPITAASS